VFDVKDPVPVELCSNVEALHISWEQPSLNKQLYCVNLTLSFWSARQFCTLAVLLPLAVLQLDSIVYFTLLFIFV